MLETMLTVVRAVPRTSKHQQSVWSANSQSERSGQRLVVRKSTRKTEGRKKRYLVQRWRCLLCVGPGPAIVFGPDAVKVRFYTQPRFSRDSELSLSASPGGKTQLVALDRLASGRKEKELSTLFLSLWDLWDYLVLQDWQQSNHGS
jgi:hypothetical protein